MMQSQQHLPVGRSTVFSLGGAYSSHQQQQQHAPITGGGSFNPANTQDLHFHGSEARNSGMLPTGSRPVNLSNTASSGGSYDHLMQQYQHFQKQSQIRLVNPFRDQDLKSTQTSQSAADRFGLLGLLNVIRMNNPDLTPLALGIDLMTLGLNLNSPDNLYKKFSSPWSDESAKGEPHYSVPECFNTKQSSPLSQDSFSRFSTETLFYIFYSMPKDEAQLFAANELHNRGWFYHRELRLWFSRAPNVELLVKTSTYERGCYYCFDPNTWDTIRKDNFVVQYEMVEDRPVVPRLISRHNRPDNHIDPVFLHPPKSKNTHTEMKLLAYVSLILSHHIVSAGGVQILSKSKLEKCEKSSSYAPLNCTRKIVIDLAVPSEASGKEASIVAQVDEVEEKAADSIKTLRDPPVISIIKSAAYAQYDLTYIRDVPYKPEELFLKTRKCEAHAGPNIVGHCERLRDEKGRPIEHTQPTCCPCGKWRRVPSSCGNFFNKMRKGKGNTAHCLRFPGDWFHVFGIGQHSVGFTIRINVRKGPKTSEVIIGPNNRTASSLDNFLRVNLVGDFVGYKSIPSFDNFFLVIPRQGSQGQPQDLGRNFSMWMLLERTRFTLDGLECDRIGVSYEAFNNQPNFCSSPFMSCLHNQLWNFWDADQNRINRNQVPLYDVQGRFERINEHPHAGSHSFSIGIAEVVNSNLLIELSADDIEYVYQRSSGNIISITVPTFQALTQYGAAVITTNNTGEVEASYSLTFDCSGGVNQMEEQFFIMKPAQIVARTFKVRPTTDQAAKYVCTAILKDSDYHETDRAECQFTTTATVLDNGTQIPWEPPKDDGLKGYFESFEDFWHALWEGMVDFITGKSCRMICSGFFDLNCHIQHLCMTWLLLFGLFLAIFPTVILLLWLLHETGLFDPIYDWWEDNFWDDERKIQHIRKHGLDDQDEHDKKKSRHHADGTHKKQKQQKDIRHEHRHSHAEHTHHNHVKRDKHKPERIQSESSMEHPLYVGERRWVKEKEEVMEEVDEYSGHDVGTTKTTHRHSHGVSDDTRHKHFHSKREGHR
ncbi:hypothetical protein SSX86_021898 [Deinandra increscens subsp. villosa]|uniref:Uncharacterized protein n=1 Tax=Deinandra increscens subsp. villosa TaxID=3103831 RepID=A0AAP0GT18_9ASTR